MDGVIVTKIRCHNHDLYDRNAKKHLYIDLNPETIPALNGNKNIDKSVFELYVEA